MIGGADILIEYPGLLRTSGGLDIAVRCIAGRWKDAIIQDAGSGKHFESYTSVPFGRLTELFVYRDEAAFESWTKAGADISNANAMVHLIADDSALTVVVDDPSDATMESIVNEVRDLLTGSQSWVRAA